MSTTIDQIIADFELLDDWEDRYRYVIELGRSSRRSPTANTPTPTRCAGAPARYGSPPAATNAADGQSSGLPETAMR